MNEKYYCTDCKHIGEHRHLLIVSKCHNCTSSYIVPYAVFEPNYYVGKQQAQVITLQKHKHLRLVK
jgi:ribosomal protein L37AE/L43A